MKKTIALLLVLIMALGLFAGCNNEENPGATAGTASSLDVAAEYLAAMYKDEPEVFNNNKDGSRVTVVMIGGVKYTVAWSANVGEDQVKITAGETTATIDINEDTDEDYSFTLTATISDADGNTKTLTFNHSVRCTKVKVDEGKVVIYYPEGGQYATEELYFYEKGNKNELVLSENKADAVVMTVRENDDGSVTFITDSGKYLFCDGSTVEFATEEGDYTKFFLEATEGGQLIRSNGTYKDNYQYLEVYSGYLTCYGFQESKANIYTFQLETVSTVSQSAILDAAYALPEGAALSDTYTLTGVITKIDTAWSADYKNITVTMVCDGDTERPMMCYRLQGEGAEFLAVGDTITVTGTIKNYNGTIEFDAKCNLDKVVKGEGNEVPDVPDVPVGPTVNILPEFTSPIAGGNQIVIVATNYNMAFSTIPASGNSYYQAGVAVTVADGTVTGYADTEIWTVIDNGDGTYSFAQGGQNIGMQDSYSSMSLGSVNDKWELIALDNGSYLLKNAVRGNYMEWTTNYGNWSTYAPDAPQNDDQFYLSIFVIG